MNSADLRKRPERVLFFAYLAVWAVLQARGDGYFPFPKTWPVSWLLPIVLAHTVVLVAAVGTAAWILLRAPRRGGPEPFGDVPDAAVSPGGAERSEEHTSELQSPC